MFIGKLESLYCQIKLVTIFKETYGISEPSFLRNKDLTCAIVFNIIQNFKILCPFYSYIITEKDM